MKSYGEPGGLYVYYELDFSRGQYVVYNEGGDELEAFDYEVDAQNYCKESVGEYV